MNPGTVNITSSWANNHGIAYLQSKTVRKYLIWCESAQWLLISGVRKFQKPLLQIPAVFITPTRMPELANDHNVANLDTDTIPMNLIWSESAKWLLSYGPDRITAGRTDGRTEIIP